MRISDWSSDVCSSDLNLFRSGRDQSLANLDALDPVAASIPELLLLLAQRQGCRDNGRAMLLVLQQGGKPHAMANPEVSRLGKGGNDLVRQFRQLQKVVEVLLGNGEPLGHLRARSEERRGGKGWVGT